MLSPLSTLHQAEFAHEHGGNAKAFAAGDVADLYAVKKGDNETLPQKLDTATKEQLIAFKKARSDAGGGSAPTE